MKQNHTMILVENFSGFPTYPINQYWKLLDALEELGYGVEINGTTQMTRTVQYYNQDDGVWHQVVSAYILQVGRASWKVVSMVSVEMKF